MQDEQIAALIEQKIQAALASFKQGPHDHDGINSPTINKSANNVTPVVYPVAVNKGGTGVATLTANQLILGNGTSALSSLGNGTAGWFLMSNGASSAPSFQAYAPSVATISVTVTAGETLAVGDVVKFYKAVGNYNADGVNMVNGTVYAVRAAANDTTYGDTVFGIMTSSATYLGTGTCAIVGDITGLSGLTAGSKHYLDNYSGSSSETITQSTGGTDFNLNDGTPEILIQTFVPTSSRIDTVKLRVKSLTGGSFSFSCYIKRGGSTTIGTSDTQSTSSTTYVEKTFTFSGGVRVYKGETLTLRMDSSAGFNAAVEYASGSNPYANGTLTATVTSIPANSDLYFKLNEYTNFGKLATSAGTRKFMMGQALSTTELAMLIQQADSQL